MSTVIKNKKNQVDNEVALSIPPEVLAKDAKAREEQETLEKLVHPDARDVGATVANPTPTPLSERVDNISLLSDDDKSEAEKRLQTQREITETWRRIESLMGNETANAWSLGDEFLALTKKEVGGTHISIREIADKVRRGKSYVDTLISTAKFFPPDTRFKRYTWFCHDLLRRGRNKCSEQFKNAEVPFPKTVKGFGEKCMTAINEKKARTGKEASAAIISVMQSEKLVDAEQVAKLQTPEVKKELQLFIRETKSGLQYIEVSDKPAPGRNTYSGWQFTKLAWKKLDSLNKEMVGSRMIIIPIQDDGKPKIDAKIAQLLLDKANGKETALADFAEKSA